jgi:hypothetical protein
MKSEEFIKQIQKETELDRVSVLLLLANTVSEGLLSTQASVLDKTFQSQSNRLVFRKLRSVLDTLEKLKFLRFGK